jgi:hypothetical protein
VSSPGTYLRYSANSTDEPRCGERWRPATLPIMGVRDSKGIAPSRASTSVSRKSYFMLAEGIGHLGLMGPIELAGLDI